jgi:hypothetical protein
MEISDFLLEIASRTHSTTSYLMGRAAATTIGIDTTQSVDNKPKDSFNIVRNRLRPISVGLKVCLTVHHMRSRPLIAWIAVRKQSANAVCHGFIRKGGHQPSAISHQSSMDRS